MYYKIRNVCNKNNIRAYKRGTLKKKSLHSLATTKTLFVIYVYKRFVINKKMFCEYGIRYLNTLRSLYFNDSLTNKCGYKNITD